MPLASGVQLRLGGGGGGHPADHVHIWLHFLSSFEVIISLTVDNDIINCHLVHFKCITYMKRRARRGLQLRP